MKAKRLIYVELGFRLTEIITDSSKKEGISLKIVAWLMIDVWKHQCLWNETTVRLLPDFI